MCQNNKEPSCKCHLFTRKVLLSTGELTHEAVISCDGSEYYDCAPFGATVGLKESQTRTIKRGSLLLSSKTVKNIINLSQSEFDEQISKKCDSQVSTAFSLAYLRLLAHRKGFSEKEIFKYLSQKYNKNYRRQRSYVIF